MNHTVSAVAAKKKVRSIRKKHEKKYRYQRASRRDIVSALQLNEDEIEKIEKNTTKNRLINRIFTNARMRKAS